MSVGVREALQRVRVAAGKAAEAIWPRSVPAGMRAAVLAAALALPFTASAKPLPDTGDLPAGPAQPDAPPELAKAKEEAAALVRAQRFADAVTPAETALTLSETTYGADALPTAVAAHNLGFVLRRVNRVMDALQHLERALAIYERLDPPVHEDVRNVIGEIGQIYMADGRAADVVALYERAMARAQKEGFADHIGLAHMHNNVAFVLRAMGDEPRSVGHWQQALAIYQTSKALDADAARAAIGALVDAYARNGKAEQGIAQLEQVLKALRDDGKGNSVAALRLLNDLSKIEHGAGRFEAARAHGAEALKLAETTGGTLETQVEPLNNMARAERALGDYTAAEQHYLSALKALQGPQHEANAGILHDNLASLYHEWGRYDAAETHHKTALALLEGKLGRDHVEVGRAAANLAALLAQAGRGAEAEPLFRRALAILEAQTPPDPVTIAVTVDNLAGLLRVTGRASEARTYLKRAAALFDDALPAGHPTIGTMRNNLGRNLLDAGAPDEAAAELWQALEIAEKNFGPEAVATAIPAANLGEALSASGRRAEGRMLLQRALAILEKQFGPAHTRLLDTLVALGQLELADGHADAARSLYSRAVDVTLAQRSRATPADALDGGASSERLALQGLLETLWQSAGEGSRETGRALEIAQWDTMSAAAVAAAARSVRTGSTDAELARLIRERQDQGALWTQLDRQMTEVLSGIGARDGLADILRSRLAAAGKKLAELDKVLDEKFPRYAELARPKPAPLAELQRHLAPGQAAVQYAVTRQAIHIFALTPSSVTWRRVDMTERDLRTAIERLRCGLDRTGWQPPGGAGAERRAPVCVTLFGAAAPAASAMLPFDRGAAERLYDKLIAPVAEGFNAKELLIVPSGPLTSLPFHTLIAPRSSALASAATVAPNVAQDAAPDAAQSLAGAPWLAKAYAVTTLPSLASLLAPAPRAGAKERTPYLALANPLLTGPEGTDERASGRQTCAREAASGPADAAATLTVASALTAPLRNATGLEQLRRLQPLPETADEVCDVARSLKADGEAVLLGARATEAQVKDLSDGGALARPRILHFATHGLLSRETQVLSGLKGEPALVLTPPVTSGPRDDGLLTASEVAALRLDADWVVLSACNTASGSAAESEALSGLARAFLYAGARSLLVSHWAVDSGAAVQLVTATAQGMSHDAALSPAGALRGAMLAMIDKGGAQAHPSYWAPFVVVGTPGAGGLGVAKLEAPPPPEPPQMPVSEPHAAPAPPLDAPAAADAEDDSDLAPPAKARKPERSKRPAVVKPKSSRKAPAAPPRAPSSPTRSADDKPTRPPQPNDEWLGKIFND